MNIKQMIRKWSSLASKYIKDNYVNIKQMIRKWSSLASKYIKDNYVKIKQILLSFKNKILAIKISNIDSIIENKENINNDDFDIKLEHIKEEKQRDEELKNTMLEKNIIELKNGFIRNQANISNQITESKNDLTREQLKIFYQCVTLINPIKDKDFNYYKISVKDFCDKLGFNKNNRSWLIGELRKMLRQAFEVEMSNGDYIGYTIFSSLRYRHAEQQIDIRFNNDMMPFLLALKDKFTRIEEVKYINQFNSKYAIRFYALLKDYRKMNYRDFNIDSLTKIFILPKSYNGSYTRLYSKVIKPAIDEINRYSDLWVKEPKIIKKQGKKVIEFRLYFGDKSIQISNDFCIELKRLYSQYNNFNFFYKSLWLDDTINEPVRIDNIFTNNDTYYQLFCNNITDRPYYQTPDKKVFIDTIINGIFRAIEWKFNEKQQGQIDINNLQSYNDKLKAYKEYFFSMI